MNLPPYPKYKPSGVEWIGDVPEHWEVKRLKYSASINDEVLAETTDPDLELSYVDIGSVHPVNGITSSEAMVFEDAPSRARRIVRDGDTIVSTVRTYLRAIAPIRDPVPNTIVSTGFAVVRPRSVSPRFMSFALSEPGFIEAIVARSVGVSYPAVNASEIGMLPIPIPETAEQQAIADFLDRETAKIDALVARQRTLIERLKEKRAALVTRTVTRGLPPDAARAAGLDPYPKFKSSSVEWIGDVPKHWKVKRLKNVATYWMSNVDKISRDNERPVRLCNYTDVYYHDHINSDMDLMQSTATPDEIDRFGLQTGDIVITKDSEDWTDIAVPALVTETAPDLVCGYHLAVIRRMKLILDSHFALHLFQSRSVNQQFQVAATGVTRYGIPKSSIGEARLPVPPLSEQRAIADFVDRETARVDDLIVKTEAAIERLREYRSTIIDAAITGKIDTRTIDTPESEPSSGSSQREDPT